MTDENQTETEEVTNDPQKNMVEAGIFAGGGAVTGALVSAKVGSAALAVAGTTLSLGIAPVAAAGAVVGLASYGLKKTFLG
jgi:integral membrane sensor domain MASE1